MPSANNFNTIGTPVTPSTIATTAVSSGIINGNSSTNKLIIGQVTKVNPDHSIYVDINVSNFGKTNAGTPIPTPIYPADLNMYSIPDVFEYVELIKDPNAVRQSSDKNRGGDVYKYGRIIPGWNNIGGNKVKDQTTPGALSSNPMTNISQNNINKAFILGGIK
jgi:hypothetical protein